MHLVIINGSPRVQKYSNTDKILSSFVKGFGKSGNTYELYSISNRSEWEAAKAAFENNTEILIAIPLYVENIPGILLEFLETLPAKKEAGTRISFILQSVRLRRLQRAGDVQDRLRTDRMSRWGIAGTEKEVGRENLMMPIAVRLNHAIADGYLVTSSVSPFVEDKFCMGRCSKERMEEL